MQISRFGNIKWPARIPDLTAPDFFLWEHLKARVYQTRSRTIQDLKYRIQTDLQEINETPDLLQSVMNNFRVRLQQVIRYQGDHLKCVILKNEDLSRNCIIQAIYCVIFKFLNLIIPLQQHVENHQNQMLDPVLFMVKNTSSTQQDATTPIHP